MNESRMNKSIRKAPYRQIDKSLFDSMAHKHQHSSQKTHSEGATRQKISQNVHNTKIEKRQVTGPSTLNFQPLAYNTRQQSPDNPYEIRNSRVDKERYENDCIIQRAVPYHKFKGSLVKGLTHSRMAKPSSLKTYSPSTKSLKIVFARQSTDISKNQRNQITDDDSTIIRVSRALAQHQVTKTIVFPPKKPFPDEIVQVYAIPTVFNDAQSEHQSFQGEFRESQQNMGLLSPVNEHKSFYQRKPRFLHPKEPILIADDALQGQNMLALLK